MLRTLPMIVLMLMLSGCATRIASNMGGAFLAREVIVDGAAHRYQVFVPAHNTSNAPAPVILFLHGSGERGRDGEKSIKVGLGPYVRAHADTFPAIVVFPQAPDDSEWGDNRALAMAALDAATREFGGDSHRTYLTGLSMGGFGVWEYAYRDPLRFAALVPICGGILAPPQRPTMGIAAVAATSDPYAQVADRLRDVPVWIFHGGKDTLVPPENSRRMHAALTAAGAPDARYTEFPEAGHNSWDAAYSQTAALWKWLFAQRRQY